MPHWKNTKDTDKSMIFLPLTFLFVILASIGGYYFLAANPVITYEINTKDNKFILEKKLIDLTMNSTTPFKIATLTAARLNKRSNCAAGGEVLRIALVTVAQGTAVVKFDDPTGCLTQRMGSTGAALAQIELVYNLTEFPQIQKVQLIFTAGDHASPGIYTRKDAGKWLSEL